MPRARLGGLLAPGHGSEHQGTAWLLVGLVLAAFCTACDVEETTIPFHLQGIWTTDAPRYGDRYMELRARHVLFGIRERGVDVYSVRRVEETIEDDKRVYTIFYGDDEGGDLSLSFYQGSDGGEEIVFKHQPQLRWTRMES